jgi:hypothetical protein
VSNPGWKQRERRIARKLGTHRIPVTGERQGADCETAIFCVQVKSRVRGIPADVDAWLAGICETARRKGKIGIVVWQAPRRRVDEAIVCLRLRDWVDLHGPVGEAADLLARPTVAG